LYGEKLKPNVYRFKNRIAIANPDRNSPTSGAPPDGRKRDAPFL
jgi:hypothetical protein